MKDKERVLYAPYTNIGSLNFENTTGYISIPDKNVIFTRLNDNEDQEKNELNLGGIDAWYSKDLDEGQKMVF